MKRSHWIGALAVLALGFGLWTAVRHFAGPASPPTTATGSSSIDEPGGDVVGEAMRNAPPAPVDSAEIKSRWHDEIRGIELGGLDPAAREIFVRFANAERCTCGCGYTLAGCKASDMSCEVSGARLEALLDSVRTGRIRSAKGLRKRPEHGA